MAPEPDSMESMRRTALQYSISRAPIFAGLPQEDLERLAGYAVATLVPRGTYLFRQGDPVTGFYLMRVGLLNVHRLDAEGREQIIHLLRPGQSFAERAITSPQGYPANARAVEDSEVILIPTEPFRQHQRERADLAWRMIASMSHHLRALVTTIEGLRFKDAETRLIHWLLQRCPNPDSTEPVTLGLSLTQEELATELAARRETVSRAFSKLRSHGHLQTSPGAVTIPNPAALQQLFQAKMASRKDAGHP